MFQDEAMESLNAWLSLKSLESARADFLAVGHKIRGIIGTTPTAFDRGPKDIPLSRRARWLKRKVINPTQILREALLDGPKFAEYPENYASSLTTEERRRIAENLEKLESFAIELHGDLAYRAEKKYYRHNIEMRREFLFWIAQVVAKHSQNVIKKRSYTGVEIDADTGKGNAAPFFAAVKLAYVQITGEWARQLDDHSKELVKMHL
jgi:hypothetical protein